MNRTDTGPPERQRPAAGGTANGAQINLQPLKIYLPRVLCAIAGRRQLHRVIRGDKGEWLGMERAHG